MRGRLPYRVLRTPVRSIAAMEPAPRHNRSRPSVPSST
jgi:hypothetical protein